MNNKKISPLLMFLTCLFVTGILISNIIAGKQLIFFKWNIPAGTLIFPVSYIVSDLISEVYGYKMSRKVAWLGFAMNIVMVFFFMVTVFWPAPVWFEGSEAYALVMGSTPRLLIAGFGAYHLGGWINDIVLSKMKTKNRDAGHDGMHGFGYRAILSTIGGEIVDSIIFVLVAFIGVMPAATLIPMIIIQATFKTVYEIIILPLTTLCVRKAKEYEGGEVFDDEVEKFSIW